MKRTLSFLSLILLLGAMGMARSSDVLEAVREMPIQHNGRIKPFDTFARETLRTITGSDRLGSEDPVATVLSIVAEPDRWQDRPLISVPFMPLREKLGLSLKTSHVSYNQLVETRRLMRMLPAIVEKQNREEKLSMLEQETMDVYERFVTLSGLLTQKPSLLSASPLALASALKGANPSAAPARWRLRLEVFANRLELFKIARFLYGAAFLSLLLGLLKSSRRASLAGIGLIGAGFFLHAAGIGIRVVLGGRPPVSNFYETMLWLPFVAVGVSLIFERIYRSGFFGLAASFLAALTLILADLVPLDPHISPVVAVLRSNLWLTVHVLTVVASYGALSLAVGLAHIYGGLYLARRTSHPVLPALGIFLYRSIQVGVVLLAAGVMLGGVWANASWGRYWGWDPKETWALITLLWFLAILHGRFAGWLKDLGVAVAAIAGFFLLLMTYYGVSFYLVGLHSYAGGHAKPVPPLLIGYLIAEIGFMLLVGLAAARGGRTISKL